MRRRCGRGGRGGSGARSQGRSRGPGPGTEPEARRGPNQETGRRFGSCCWRIR